MLLLKILENKILIINKIHLNTVATLAAVFFLYGCGTQQTTYYKIRGLTMGTTYSITYKGKDPVAVQKVVEEVLAEVNQSLSTYIPSSVIAKVNQLDTFVAVDQHFINVFNEAKNVHQKTNGAFDPTIAPLVNAWGFGFKKPQKPADSAMIDSLRMLVGFDQVVLQNQYVIKSSPFIQLDFSAIAKGYGVDQIALALEQLGYTNYLVEIGGEVYANGVNSNNTDWVLGIEEPKPKEQETKMFAQVQLNDEGLATSGNYKNYRVENGATYFHTIDPKSGYPKRHRLLSASIVSSNCMKADAYATAFMVLGKEEAIKIAELYPNEVKVFLIFENENNQLDYFKSKELNKKARLSL